MSTGSAVVICSSSAFCFRRGTPCLEFFRLVLHPAPRTVSDQSANQALAVWYQRPSLAHGHRVALDLCLPSPPSYVSCIPAVQSDIWEHIAKNQARQPWNSKSFPYLLSVPGELRIKFSIPALTHGPRAPHGHPRLASEIALGYHVWSGFVMD
ncbi:hypothetical protein BJV78DRAFT_145377 [Lactifluus subvellereus]|nr:hypothetical protein BJV78DRAFT_145377 [Lactifluus subvellereus]